MTETYVSGGVISPDPLVTYSLRSPSAPLGVASVLPPTFRRRKALHLVGLSWTLELEDQAKRLANDLKAAAGDLSQSRFCILTNTEFEAHLLADLGVPAAPCSLLIFIDDAVFRPLDCAIEFDAVYNATLSPAKRHELAREVASLALLYDVGAPGLAMRYDETRTLLPRAAFLNHDAGAGAYRQFPISECAAQINRGRVGLCLSAAEGPMQAAMEYLLCGLPVVSTRSFGGRDRYFMPPFCRIVDDDPKAVAAAVAGLAERRIPKQAVRNFIMHVLRFERHNFLLTVNKLVHETFGVEDRFPTFTPFASGLTRWRKVGAVLAALEGGAS